MTETQEVFDHTPRSWTVGELRAALEGMPDEVPVVVHVAEYLVGTLSPSKS